MTKQFRFRMVFVLIALALVAVPMAMTYTTSYTIDRLNKQHLALEADIESQRNAIRVLQAEWAYLAEPSRIERLAASYLKMERPVNIQVSLAKDFDKTTAPAIVASVEKKPAEKKVVVTSATPAPSHAAGYQPAAFEAPTPNGVKVLLASFKQ